MKKRCVEICSCVFLLRYFLLCREPGLHFSKANKLFNFKQRPACLKVTASYLSWNMNNFSIDKEQKTHDWNISMLTDSVYIGRFVVWKRGFSWGWKYLLKNNILVTMVKGIDLKNLASCPLDQCVKYKAWPTTEFMAHLTSQLDKLTSSKTKTWYVYISDCASIKQARHYVFKSEI